jgi:urease accessory protein
METGFAVPPINSANLALLRLLQLASPALPVGAYSYSEGLETLAHQQRLKDVEALQAWLEQELKLGSVRVDGGILVRAYEACRTGQPDQLLAWNAWLTAARDTEELRSQSLQMGRSLLKLFQALHPEWDFLPHLPHPHFCVAFGAAAAAWNIPLDMAVAGYLHSWASNLVNAGIKLIPLGQTSGQRLLEDLVPQIQAAAIQIQSLPDHELESCSWGLSLASMQHEGLYSRLFRS